MRASRVWRVALPVAVVTVLFTACSSDESSTASETVDITMVDNAFQPDRITVPRGERVTLRFTNEGTVRHEALVGDDTAQLEHHRDMEEGAVPGMDDDGHGGGHGTADDAVTVEPGEQGSMTMTLDEDLVIGCHEPGHWEVGMKGTVSVR